MSCDGKAFTYVNQLASSDNDLSRRSEWFTCACCPPNVARLLGYLGGYFWTAKVDESGKNVSIYVHMYGSATLTVPVGDSIVTVKQVSDWPWDGKIRFEVLAPEGVRVDLNLRIPSWASVWQVRLKESFSHLISILTPEKLPSPLMDVPFLNGYARVPATWVDHNSRFELNIPLKPRVIRPHPYSNQDIVALARGPIVYCVEDVDNLWVDDHFKVRLNHCMVAGETRLILLPVRHL